MHSFYANSKELHYLSLYDKHLNESILGLTYGDNSSIVMDMIAWQSCTLSSVSLQYLLAHTDGTDDSRASVHDGLTHHLLWDILCMLMAR